jgi:predicted TIM-barrel fold metal-dependent hydrolase
MVATKVATIIDGDGHVMEDQQAIARFIPEPFSSMYRRGGVFPPLDHLHLATGQLPPAWWRSPSGESRQVGPGDWVEFLQELDLRATVLYPTAGLAYGRIVNRDWALAATRAYNDWLYNTYLTVSPRFKGMALIPLQEPEAAVEELRRAVNELGMCGAMLPATGLSEPLGAKRYWPIYAEAERLGCCLAIHGGSHNGMGLDYLNVHAGVHGLGHPFGILISFASMLFNGIFDKYPGSRIAFLEAGVAWLFMAMERLQGSYASHVTDDPRQELFQLRSGENVSGYIRRQIGEGRLYVGVEGDEPLLAAAVQAVGNGPFLYSSDFPHEVNNETCREEIEELLENDALTQADKEAILSRNAERFYHLAAQ